MNNPWYRRFPSDFINGTVGLSLEEKGAYSLILDLIYARGGPIPDDARYISGVCGCSLRKWAAIRNVLLERGKIEISDGLISNNRAIIEVETAAKFSRKLAENGAKGGRKRAENQSSSNKINDLTEAPLKHHAREHNNTIQEDKNYSSSSTREREPTPREILREILSEETTAAVMKHRQAKRAPLSTALAARGLVKGFLEYPAGPEAAAELMLTSGWTCFKREFWDKRPMAGGQRRMTAAEETGQRLAERIRELQNGGGQPAYSGGEGSVDLWGPQRLPANR